MSPPRRAGIFGGTFDPPHVAHLVAAVTASYYLGLDELLVMPAGDPWQKQHRPVTPAPVRLAMAEALFGDRPGLSIDDRELRRPGPTHTVDTLAQLRTERDDEDLVLILGVDAATGLRTWPGHERIPRLARLAVLDRVDDQVVADTDAADGAGWERVPMPRLDVSSSDVRARVAAGVPVEGLVPDGVVTLIGEHHLYRGGR